MDLWNCSSILRCFSKIFLICSQINVVVTGNVCNNITDSQILRALKKIKSVFCMGRYYTGNTTFFFVGRK